MRTLGLIGGTSWHSTIEYYRIINQSINDHFGDNTNPPLVLYNLNQALVHRYQVEDNWDGVAELIITAAKRLESAGVDAVMCCANTPHKVYTAVQEQASVPVLHIADATAKVIKAASVDAVGFLGTKFSMSEDFVTGRIAEHGINVLVPESVDEQEALHRIIQQELTFGQINDASKRAVLSSIAAMVSRGARGIVLGCTEFPLMISESDLDLPIFNTTEIHAIAGVEFVLGLNGS